MQTRKDLRDQTSKREGWSTYLEKISKQSDLATNSIIPN